MWSILRQTIDEFQKDECPRLAAALAFYTVFSLPALVIAIVTITGFIVGRDVAESRLLAYVEETTSSAVKSQIESVLKEAHKHDRAKSWLAGMAVLLAGATGALVEVQTALNRAWNVEADPKKSTWATFIIKRLFSLGMLLAIAFLLLVSLVVSWAISEFGQWIDAYAPAWLSAHIIGVINFLVSLAIIMLLFAAILKYMPDVRLAWRDVWAGAAVTAILFVLGKTGMGIYLAWSNPTSAYGAAGSVALVLLWIYYSAMILFLGAEFTQVLAQRRGTHVEPQAGCMLTECDNSELAAPTATKGAA
jgi:membrane protein